MKIFKNENSFDQNLKIIKNKNSKKISFLNLKLIHRIFDSLNISFLILIFILSFLSFDSQRKWTSIYKNLDKTRSNNKTEEFYVNEIESLDSLKKTTPKDLIYLDKQVANKKKSNFNKTIKYFKDGLKDSKFQKGY